MSQYQRMGNAKPLERFVDQFRLCYGGPNNITGAITVAKAGTIENNHAIILRTPLDQPARLKILNQAAVAVEKDQGFPCATLDVV